jgi:biopolymer transport protein ExbD
MSALKRRHQLYSENTMQIDSTLQKLEVHVVAAVAVILVCALAFAVSAPFSADDYSLPDAATTASPPARSSASEETQPALLEPALRSLEGVSYHG